MANHDSCGGNLCETPKDLKKCPASTFLNGIALMPIHQLLKPKAFQSERYIFLDINIYSSVIFSLYLQ